MSSASLGGPRRDIRSFMRPSRRAAVTASPSSARCGAIPHSASSSMSTRPISAAAASPSGRARARERGRRARVLAWPRLMSSRARRSRSPRASPIARLSSNSSIARSLSPSLRYTPPRLFRAAESSQPSSTLRASTNDSSNSARAWSRFPRSPRPSRACAPPRPLRAAVRRRPRELQQARRPVFALVDVALPQRQDAAPQNASTRRSGWTSPPSASAEVRKRRPSVQYPRSPSTARSHPTAAARRLCPRTRAGARASPQVRLLGVEPVEPVGLPARVQLGVRARRARRARPRDGRGARSRPASWSSRSDANSRIVSSIQ